MSARRAGDRVFVTAGKRRPTTTATSISIGTGNLPPRHAGPQSDQERRGAAFAEITTTAGTEFAEGRRRLRRLGPRRQHRHFHGDRRGIARRPLPASCFKIPGTEIAKYVKLVIRPSRVAAGARIKVHHGRKPLTVHRHVNGNASAAAIRSSKPSASVRARRLEIYWPTSPTTQVFRNVDVNQAQVTGFPAIVGG